MTTEVRARASISLRPQRSAIAPQNGAMTELPRVVVENRMPDQSARSPTSFTPSSRTNRGMKGVTIEKPSSSTKMARSKTYKLRRHRSSGEAALVRLGITSRKPGFLRQAPPVLFFEVWGEGRVPFRRLGPSPPKHRHSSTHRQTVARQWGDLGDMMCRNSQPDSRRMS